MGCVVLLLPVVVVVVVVVIATAQLLPGVGVTAVSVILLLL